MRQQADGKTDFAIVTLDRPVTGRKPLRLRRSGEIALGEEVTVIGNPSGIPTKIAAHGVVRDVSRPEFFVAGTDTFGGNSGSAVLNGVTGEVEGILVRGEQDFSMANGCHVSKRCAVEGCRGEDVTRSAMFQEFVSVVE